MNPASHEADPVSGPNPEFMRKFEEVIKSYATATEAGKAEEAQMAALQALMMAGEEVLNNPTPSLILKQKADDLEGRTEWVEAEKIRREILVMEVQTGNFGLIAKAQMDLSRLMRTLGRFDEASQFARDAVCSARRADVFPLLVMALQIEAFCELERGKWAEALALASEALAVIKPGKMSENMKARALITRARCRLANGDYAGAAQDLELGREQKWDMAKFCGLPGPTLALANWWETKAMIEHQQENLHTARESLKQSIDYRRQFDSPHSRFSLAGSFTMLAEFCREAGDLDAERSARAEAQSLLRDLRRSISNQCD